MSNEAHDEEIQLDSEELKSPKLTCLTVIVLICAYSPVLAVFAYFMAKIIYAAAHLSGCPHSPMVPIAVLVSGFIPLLGCAAFGVGHKVKVKVESKRERMAIDRYITLSLFLVMLLWVIIESPFVFPAYNKALTRTTNSTDTECSSGFLQFAFVTIIIDWVSVSVGLVAFLCCWCTVDIIRSLCP